MSYAIIETGGKQYRVETGQVFRVEKLPEGERVVFDQVLLVADEKGIKIGTPTVSGAKVTAKQIKQGRGKKITVIHYKAKIRHKKVAGHRQPYSEVEIESIG